MMQPFDDIADELRMEEMRLEALEIQATKLEDLNLGNCPLHLQCRKTAGCPYIKQGMCDYPYIADERVPAYRQDGTEIV